MSRLNADTASKMARIALGHVTREYPSKLQHAATGDDDVLPPRTLYPIFFGSFDWHSCVHGWWSLLTLRRLFPQMAESLEIGQLADSSFTAEKVAVERAYFERPLSRQVPDIDLFGQLDAPHTSSPDEPAARFRKTAPAK